MEDRAGAWDMSCGKLSPNPDFSVWAVFDGHGSAAISSYLQTVLHTRLEQRLCAAVLSEATDGHRQFPELHDGGSDQLLRSSAIRTALHLAFDDVDRELRSAAASGGASAAASCASAHAYPSSVVRAPAAAAAAAAATATAAAGGGGTGAVTPGGLVMEGAAVENPAAQVAEMPPAPAEASALAAAAAASWDSGSTAVLAVVDWRQPRSADRRHAGADGTSAGAGTCAADAADTQDAEARGELWVASVGNSRAVLCVPAAASVQADGPPAAGGSHAGCARWGEGDPLAASAGSKAAGVAASGKIAGMGPARVSRRGSVAASAAATASEAEVAAEAEARAGAQHDGAASGRLAARVLNAVHELHDEQESARVEAAGGRVELPSRPGGKRRLMGDLEVSRAFGDLQYRHVGLTASPDVAGPLELRESGCRSGGPPAGSEGCPVPAALLVLASDGVLDVMGPQDVCDHAEAQLSGAAQPALAPPPPPPIALGPIGDSALTGTRPEPPDERLRAASDTAGGGEVAGGEAAGLPGCCDCDLAATVARTQAGEDPCKSQVLPQRMHRRQAYRTVQFAAQRLVQEAVNRGSMDNVAAIVVQLPASVVARLEAWQPCTESAGHDTARPGALDVSEGNRSTGMPTACRPAGRPPTGQPAFANQLIVETNADDRSRREGTGPQCDANAAGRAGINGLTPSLEVAGRPQPDNAPTPSFAIKRLSELAERLAGEEVPAAALTRGDPDVAAAAVAAVRTTSASNAKAAPAAEDEDRAIGGHDGGGPVVPWRWDPTTEAPRWPAPGAASLRRCKIRMQPTATGAGAASSHVQASTPARSPAGHSWTKWHKAPGDLQGSDDLESAGEMDGGSTAGGDVHSLAPFDSGSGSGLGGGGLAIRLLRLLRRRLGAVHGRFWGNGSRVRSGVGINTPRGAGASGTHDAGGGAAESGPAGSLVVMCPRPGGSTARGAAAGPKRATGLARGRCSPRDGQCAGADGGKASLANRAVCLNPAAEGNTAAAGPGAADCSEPGSQACDDDGAGLAGLGVQAEGDVPGDAGSEADGGPDDDRGEGHGYLLKERIAAVPSSSYHRHSPTPGIGEPLPPWQLSDFAGASYFMVPGLPGGTAGWLIDSLHSYYAKSYDPYDHVNSFPNSPFLDLPDGGASLGTGSGDGAWGHLPLSQSRNAITAAYGGGATTQITPSGDGADGDDARALMSYSCRTHSLLLEIGSVPLQLALSGPGAGGGAVASGGGGTRSQMSHLQTPLIHTYQDVEPNGLQKLAHSLGDPADGNPETASHNRRQDSEHVDPKSAAHDLGWGDGLALPHLSLMPAADDVGLSLGVGGGRRGRALLWDDEADSGGHGAEELGSAGSAGEPEEDGGLRRYGGEGAEPWRGGAPAAGGPGWAGGEEDGPGGVPVVDVSTRSRQTASRGVDVKGSAEGEGGGEPVVTLLGRAGRGGGFGPEAGSGGRGGGSAAVVIGGAQLQSQPRAHGVRQADGAVHLVTTADAAGSDGSSTSGGGQVSPGGRAAVATPTAESAGDADAGASGGGGGSKAVAREYRLRERFGQGHFGEVWRAWRLERGPLLAPAPATAGAASADMHDAPPGVAQQRPLHHPRQQPQGSTRDGDADSQEKGQATGLPDASGPGREEVTGSAGAAAPGVHPGYVLKRLRGDGGAGILLSGLREAYFGDLLMRLRAAAAGPAAADGGSAGDGQGWGRDGSGGGGGGGSAGGRGRFVPGGEPRRRWSPSGHDHLVDFIESFEVDPEPDPYQSFPNSGASSGGAGLPGGAGRLFGEGAAAAPDLWIVFGDAGQSLHDLIYSPVGLRPLEPEVDEPAQPGGPDGGGSGGGGSFQVLGPSPWWHAMRQHRRGNDFVRELLRQLLLGLQVVHEANITHRDIKPENMMLTAVPLPRRSGGGGSSSMSFRAEAREGAPPPAATEPTGAQSAWQRLGAWAWRGGAPAPPSGPTAQPREAASTPARGGVGLDAGGADAATSGGVGASGGVSGGSQGAWDTGQHGGGKHGGGGQGQAQAQAVDAAELGGGSEAEVDGTRTEFGDPHVGAAGAGPDPGDDSAVAPVWLRLIDFGSAVDGYSLQHLYGSEGPTSDQLTLEYAPPEALFGRYWEGMRAMRPRAWTYDIWSVGVVWLELLMATPQVWQLPAATRALLEVRLALRGRPESERHLVFLLRGLMEWCIYPPQAPSTAAHGPPLRGRKSRLLMSWSCTEEALLALARSRDPLGLGLEGPMALRLLMRLLHWDPASRPSARQALQHAFFTLSPADWVSHTCGAVAEGEPGWC